MSFGNRNHHVLERVIEIYLISLCYRTHRWKDDTIECGLFSNVIFINKMCGLGFLQQLSVLISEALCSQEAVCFAVTSPLLLKVE